MKIQHLRWGNVSGRFFCIQCIHVAQTVAWQEKVRSAHLWPLRLRSSVDSGYDQPQPWSQTPASVGPEKCRKQPSWFWQKKQFSTRVYAGSNRPHRPPLRQNCSGWSIYRLNALPALIHQPLANPFVNKYFKEGSQKMGTTSTLK